MPFGDDKQALANALWLETDRRYHEAVTALGYVKQDQATLTKRDERRPTSRREPAEVYVEAPAKLEFDKAQWVDRLKRCSAKALKGVATRGTCGVVFQLNTAYFVNSEGSADPAVVDERAAVGVGRRQGRRRHEPVAARAAVRPHARPICRTTPRSTR